MSVHQLVFTKIKYVLLVRKTKKNKVLFQNMYLRKDLRSAGKTKKFVELHFGSFQ